jgi:hypothetical protein
MVNCLVDLSQFNDPILPLTMRPFVCVICLDAVYRFTRVACLVVSLCSRRHQRILMIEIGSAFSFYLELEIERLAAFTCFFLFHYHNSSNIMKHIFLDHVTWKMFYF